MVMKIPSSALFSVVLMATTIGAMGIPAVTVNVANFPLDEQGNLQTSVMNEALNVNVANWATEPEAKTMTVVQNLTVTAPNGGEATVANVSVAGYRYVSIFIAYQHYDWYKHFYYESSCQGINVRNDLYLHKWDPVVFFTTGVVGFEVGAPNLVFKVGCPYGPWAIVLTIVLYCYN